jgi:inorganic pyrophosphatase
MSNLTKIEAFSPDGELRMIVETPRGSAVKLKYEPKLKAFTVARSLPVGVTYPFDWGFIPGTEGEDGDPLDALAIHDSATYPRVILPCRLLGVIHLTQNAGKGREANPRFILLPVWHGRFGEFAKAAELPDRLKKEIEQFFLSVDFFTGKDAAIDGWKGPNAAEKAIRKSLKLQPEDDR